MRVTLMAATLLGIASAWVRGQDVWTLTTSDFVQQEVTVVGLDAQGASVTVSGEKDPKPVPAGKLLRIERKANAVVLRGLVLGTRGGDRYVGTPAKLDGETLVWTTTSVGEVRVRLSDVASVLRVTPEAKPSVEPAADSRTQDVVRLINGDSVVGIVNSIDDKTVAIQPAAGNEARVPLDSVAAVYLATTAGPATAPAARAFRVSLVDGSAVSCSAVKLEGDTLALTPVAGPQARVAAAQVTAIEQVNGPVAWLSDRTPVESTHTPFLDVAFPTRMNQTVLGNPIAFGPRTYARGIGVHSRSVIKFDLLPGDKTFRTRFAVDGDLPYADLAVRVLLDDKVAFEQGSVRAGKLSDVVTIDLAGAKTITLEADYGKGYDVQDRLNWIEPAVLRDEAQ